MTPSAINDQSHAHVDGHFDDDGAERRGCDGHAYHYNLPPAYQHQHQPKDKDKDRGGGGGHIQSTLVAEYAQKKADTFVTNVFDVQLSPQLFLPSILTSNDSGGNGNGNDDSHGVLEKSELVSFIHSMNHCFIIVMKDYNF